MKANRQTPASRIAFGGMMTALAVVIMSLGGLIPIATYTSPVLCMVIGQLVLQSCGARIGWAWYGAAAILSLLLSPDREAAGVFVFLGYYPMLKPKLDGKKLGKLWKLLYFNGSICLLYALLIRLFGMDDLSSEFREFGAWMLYVLLILGNVTFLLTDVLLTKVSRGRLRRG